MNNGMLNQIKEMYEELVYNYLNTDDFTLTNYETMLNFEHILMKHGIITTSITNLGAVHHD